MMDNVEERNEYFAHLRRDVVLYETTPWWRFWARTRRMAAVRRAAGNYAYAGGNPNIPRTLRGRIGNRLAIIFTDGLTYLVMFVVAVILGLVWAFAQWDGPSPDPPPKALPAGIVQRGFSFYIPAGYAATQDYKNVDAAEKLCNRLPEWEDLSSSYDDHDVITRKGGVIEIHCLLKD
jgi:hypothetical protein